MVKGVPEAAAALPAQPRSGALGLLQRGGFVRMDRCCDDQRPAEAAGTPAPYPAEEAAWLAPTLGSSRFAWLSFQTLWDDIASSDPDLQD